MERVTELFLLSLFVCECVFLITSPMLYPMLCGKAGTVKNE